MAVSRKRFYLEAGAAFRAQEGRRRNPRHLRLAMAGSLPLSGDEGRFPLGPTGRRRKTPSLRWAVLSSGPSGRLCLDPHARSGGVLRKPAPEQTSSEDVPLRLIEEPDYLIFAVLEKDRKSLGVADTAALEAARSLADGAYGTARGAVVAVSVDLPDGLERAGADRVLRLPDIDGYEADSLALHIAAAMKIHRPRHVVFPETPAMRDVAARLAALMDEHPALGVHHFEGVEAVEVACVRRGFGGTQDLHQSVPCILTVMEGAATPLARERFEARLLEDDGPEIVASSAIEDLGQETIPADQIALEEAPFIMSAGAGVKDWAAFEAVAQRLNATRAGTRVVCDEGLMDRDRQVGASGRIVDAECYLALGLSGAIQHLQGIETCDRVVAVNIDSAAPIMKRADLAIVCDVNAILAALDEKLKGRQV